MARGPFGRLHILCSSSVAPGTQMLVVGSLVVVMMFAYAGLILLKVDEAQEAAGARFELEMRELENHYHRAMLYIVLHKLGVRAREYNH